jgi:hypothetical protein
MAQFPTCRQALLKALSNKLDTCFGSLLKRDRGIHVCASFLLCCLQSISGCRWADWLVRRGGQQECWEEEGDESR